jgi:hypothetical protein
MMMINDTEIVICMWRKYDAYYVLMKVISIERRRRYYAVINVDEMK